MNRTLQPLSRFSITRGILFVLFCMIAASTGLLGVTAKSSAAGINVNSAANLSGSCGAPSFGPATNFPAGMQAQSVAAADFNEDGILDLAVPNATSANLTILLGNGLGGFTSGGNYTTGDGPGQAVTADFNHDGHIDIATANPGGFLDNISVMLGTGNGTFGDTTNYTAGTTTFSIDVGDLNHDNNLDLVAANFNSANISILLGNGSGRFGSATNIPVGIRPVSIKAGDFNGDSNLDVAVADSDSNAVWILLGNGSGGFGAPVSFAAGQNVRGIAVADLNHDNYLDIVVTNSFSNTVSILLGNGDGTFQAPQSLAVPSDPNSVSVADLNNDGNLDLAVATDSPSGISVLAGDGLGGFAAPVNFATGPSPSSVAIGDYNGDGGLDIATANTGSNTVSVLLNNCHAPATATPPPTETATSTSTATATATATASATASATATVCSIQFSDVQAGSTFYAYVQCLACRGIISGYSDGTFRPENNVTRGQAAKIVANSAGYNDVIPPTRQTFTDVPNTSTFWVYIERVAQHGAISGYSDGTFRPENNVTRGQLSKIDAVVKGYNDVIPPTRQTFTDVPNTSTFWVYIERIALHSVISGYSDGTFRPENNVTRGQASKIVSLTFYPECSSPQTPRP